MEYNVYGFAAEKIDDVIYFSDHYSNTLYSYNVKKRVVFFVSYFSCEENRDILYMKAYRYFDKIFFIPWNARNIAVFDAKKSEIEYIKMPNAENKYDTQRVEDYIYFSSTSDYSILRLNLEKEEITTIDLNDVGGYKQQLLYPHRRCRYVSKELIILPGKKDKQYSFSIHEKKVIERILPFDVEEYSKCICWNKKLIYIPFFIDNGLIIYDAETNRYESLSIDKEKTRVASVAHILNNDDLILLPVLGHFAYSVHLDKGEVEKYNLKEKYDIKNDDIGFQNVIIDEKDIYVFSDRNPIILKIDKDRGMRWKIEKLTYNNCELSKRIKEIRKHKDDIGFKSLNDNDLVMYENADGLINLFMRILTT